ncbi:P-loop containing nucleoside triphosphate hydrolase protein [Crepidotus variabilis]|uniref:P-loop containing nucleoside triphosphate hydrolase protein n=1 Tax=Crepidotus variabilis TaxID=179855 RepID=A0A9P6JHL7_9AGAR|nr:P-loop containing nucleoside triphosphate hydrolase protein [Crepidotus variabilis]
MPTLSASSQFLIIYLTYLHAPVASQSVDDILGLSTPWDDRSVLLPHLNESDSAVVQMFISVVGFLDLQSQRDLLAGVQHLDPALREAETRYAEWYRKVLGRRIQPWIQRLCNEAGVLTNARYSDLTPQECADKIAPTVVISMGGNQTAVNAELLDLLALHIARMRHAASNSSTAPSPVLSSAALLESDPSDLVSPSDQASRERRAQPLSIGSTSPTHPLPVAVVGTSAPQQHKVEKKSSGAKAKQKSKQEPRFYDMWEKEIYYAVSMSFLCYLRRSSTVPSLTQEQMWETFSSYDSLGVAGLDELSDEELLDFWHRYSRRPQMFAPCHCAANPALTSWDNPADADERNKFVFGGPGFVDFALQRHQIVALCALFHRSFCAAEKTDRIREPTHVMLADGMGLGKTITALAYIAELMFIRASPVHLAHLQDTDFALAAYPGFLARDKRFSFMGRGAIPARPHLIIVPNAVYAQWISEIRRFFFCGWVDLFEVPTEQDEFEEMFFSENGPYRRSPLDNCFKILLCTDTVFGKFASAHFDLEVPKGTAADAPRKILKNAPSDSLMTLSFNVCIIDEAHDIRHGAGGKYVGMCHLARSCNFVIALTGTPIYAQPRDALNIFRMLRIERLHGAAGDEFLRRHAKSIRRASSATPKVASNDSDDDQADDPDMLDPEVLQALAEDDTSTVPVFTPTPTTKAKTRMCNAMLQRAGHAMIRRTHASRGFANELIIDIPPKISINYWINLSPQELASIKTIVAAGLTKKATRIRHAGATLVISRENFMSRYRTEIAVPTNISSAVVSSHPPVASTSSSKRQSKKNKANTANTRYPPYSSITDFQTRAGNKLKHLVRLLTYLLADDDASAVDTFDTANGEMLLPPLPIRSGPAPQTRKILVSFTFTMMLATIRSAMQLHGIDSFVFTGNDNPQKRVQILQQWKSSLTNRVLIMSQVGAVGLNLTEASVVIHYDSNWSGLHEDQIDARACRYGQTKTVHCYHLLAKGTSDVLIDSNAREKHVFLAGLTENGGEAEGSGDFPDDPICLLDLEAEDARSDEDEEEVRRLYEAEPEPDQSSPLGSPPSTEASPDPRLRAEVVTCKMKQELTTPRRSRQSAPSPSPSVPEAPLDPPAITATTPTPPTMNDPVNDFQLVSILQAPTSIRLNSERLTTLGAAFTLLNPSASNQSTPPLLPSPTLPSVSLNSPFAMQSPSHTAQFSPGTALHLDDIDWDTLSHDKNLWAPFQDNDNAQDMDQVQDDADITMQDSSIDGEVVPNDFKNPMQTNFDGGVSPRSHFDMEDA